MIESNLLNVRFPNKQFLKLTAGIAMVLCTINSFGQAIIVKQDFETTPAVPTMTYSNAGGTVGAITPGTPAGASTAAAGARGYYITSGTAVITTSGYDTRCYSSPYLSFRLAALSSSGGNGMDHSDIVTVAISTNGGATFENEMIVSGTSTAGKATWSYTGGTGTASSIYDGNSTVETSKIWSPLVGGHQTSEGYSTVTLTGLPNITSLIIRVTLQNNHPSETWAIDNLGLYSATAVNASGASTVPAVSRCGTGAVTLTASGAATGQSYKWYNAATAGTLLQTGGATFTTPSLSANTNYYVSTYTTSLVNCESASRTTAAVTITASSVGGTVTAAQTVCAGTTVASLTVSGQTGAIIKWQKASDAAFTTPTDIAATTTTLSGTTIGSLSVSTYFRAVVQNGICSTANSAAVLITVTPASAGGSVTASQTICTGTTPATMTLTGYTGTIIKWQKASDSAFTTPTDIVNTASTLAGTAIGTLTASTYFRAVVRSGTCTTVNSSFVLVTVSGPSVGGTVSSNQTVCSGATPLAISLSGNTGTVVKWQKSTDASFTVVTDVVSTATTLAASTIGVMTLSRYFRAVVQSGTCPVAYSSSILFTVTPLSVAGTVSSAQNMCSGATPVALTLTGNSGAITKWQKSADSLFTTPTDILATTATLAATSMGALSTSTYFRAVVQSGSCAIVYSSSVLITVIPTAVGGTVSSNQTICSGMASGDLTLSGQSGTIIKWQKSTDSAFTTSVDIANTTTTLPSATIGTLTTTTYFRAVVQSGTCAAANSSYTSVSVGDGLAPNFGAASNFALFTITGAVGNTGASNVTGDIGTNLGAVTLFGAPSSLNGTIHIANAETLSAVTDLTAAYNQLYATSPTNSIHAAAFGSGETLRAGVYSIPAAGSVAGTLILDAQGNPNAVFIFKFGGALTTGAGTIITLLNGASALNIFWVANGAISMGASTSMKGTLVGNGAISMGASGSLTGRMFSIAGAVTIDSTIAVAVGVNGTVISDQNIVPGIPANLTLSGNTGTIIKWQKSLTVAFTAPIDIANTTNTLTGAAIGILNTTTYFRAVVHSGSCTASYSRPAVIIVSGGSVGGTLAANQTICSGTSPLALVLTQNTGNVTKWQKSADSGFTTPVDIASSASALTAIEMGTLTDTTYFRALVQNGSSAIANSSTVIITVTPLAVGGSVSSDQTINSGTAAASLTLSGHTGTIIKWQKSTTAAFIAPTDIANTATTLTGATIGSLTATTYFRAVLQSGSCSTENSAYATVLVNLNASWTGTVSTDWANPANWSNALLPSLATNITIPATTIKPIISSNATARSLTIATGATLTVNTGFDLKVTDVIANSGTLTVLNDANLIQTNNVTNTGTGSTVVKRSSSALMRQDYVLWSSPVVGQLLQPFSSSTLAARFYTYTADTNVYSVVAAPASTAFATGTGYLIRVPNTFPVLPTIWPGFFTGTRANNGNITVPVTSGAYNAIGNPYPSPINADDFMAANGINEALYFWRKTNAAVTTAYATYTLAGGTATGFSGHPLGLTPNNIIQTGQGFIVKATSNSISFTNDMRIGSHGQQLLRSASIERNRLWLNLTNNAGVFSQTMIAYMTNATNAIDQGIDGRYFDDSQSSLTTLIDGAEFAVQGRQLPFDREDTVALGFKTPTAGNFTIAIDHFDGLFSASENIFLIDYLTNQVHDLRAGAYTFAVEAGASNTRFQIKFKNPFNCRTCRQANTALADENGIVVYKQDQELIINSGSITMSEVNVYDIRGRVLIHKTNINAKETILNCGTTHEVLLVQITSDSGATTTKKIIN